MPVAGKLELGKTYKTLKGGLVKIVQEKAEGRKLFVGELEDGTQLGYFRNGRFSNASERKGGHRFDILREYKPRKKK